MAKTELKRLEGYIPADIKAKAEKILAEQTPPKTMSQFIREKVYELIKGAK
jgi:hypothetical protein